MSSTPAALVFEPDALGRLRALLDPVAYAIVRVQLRAVANDLPTYSDLMLPVLRAVEALGGSASSWGDHREGDRG